MLRLIYFIFSLIIFPLLIHGNVSDTVSAQREITLSGYVTDAENGERLAGVSVIETNLKTGTPTNEYGYYTMSIPAGKWTLQLTCIGYMPVTNSGQSTKNTLHNFVMERNETQLGEVVIEATRSDENVRAPAMGIVKLDVRTIKAMPSLLGEIDVEMKEGDSGKPGFAGSIGTISSKLTVDGPVIKDRTTFLVAGRRTYADIFLPYAKEEDIRDNRLYFWDANIKLSHILNEKNRLYFTGYSGKDIFKNDYSQVEFGNMTGSLRWNHIFSNRLFMNLNLITTRYNYNLGTPEDGTGSFSFLWDSRITDYHPRLDFTHYLNDNHKLRYGLSVIYHDFFPGEISGTGNTSGRTYFRLPTSTALESGLYISDEYALSGNLTIKYGLRFAMFQNIGPGTYYEYNNDYIPVDSIKYPGGKIFNTRTALEPRFAFTYLLNDLSSIKGSYSHTAQFVTLAQNSSSGTPLNIWFPATPNVEPQLCDQFALGYFRNLGNDTYEVSGEVYYKSLRKLIDFRDHAELFLNQYLEGELRRGRGYSYGLETLLRRNQGFLTGWISYTYSRSFRVVPDINNGNRYPSLYDKPHTVNLVTTFALSQRITASSTWTYSTGLPLTLPTGRAVIGNSIIPVYSDRNSYRMEDYHRLDLSVSLHGKEKPGKKWHSELNLSVYNLYSRHNSWAINIVTDDTDPYVTYAERTYLFAVIPALTWNIKF